MPVPVRVDASDASHLKPNDPALAAFVRQLGVRAGTQCGPLEQLVVRGYAGGEFVFFAYSYRRAGWALPAPIEMKEFERQREAYRESTARARNAKQACRNAPRRDLWSVATGRTLLPNTCQKMLAFEDALLAQLRLGSQSPSSCRLIRPEGCSFKFVDTHLQVKMQTFGVGNCRADGICALSAKVTCSAYVRGQTNAGLSSLYCIARGLMPSWSYTSAGRKTVTISAMTGCRRRFVSNRAFA